MKKTLAMLLAIVISAVAICTLTITAFANPEETEPVTEPVTEIITEKATEAATEAETLPGVQLPDALKPTTTAAATEATTEAATQAATEASTKTPETSLAGTEVVTNPEGVTSIDDGDETTKAPAKVDNVIPDTGSNVVVPAVALLVLAAGTVAVVKTKKD